jgi:hypothetical protein
VVHREMLVPKSRADIGVTEGRGMKLGMSFPVDPLADSDTGMERYLWSVKRAGDDMMGRLPWRSDTRRGLNALCAPGMASGRVRCGAG